jgi:hypothetical protein
MSIFPTNPPNYSIHLSNNTTGIGTSTYGTGISVTLSNNPEFQDLVKKIEQIQKSLCILEPDFELHEKFPALKEAYEYYKLIEKLVYNEENKI